MWGRTCVWGHQEGQGTFGVTNSMAVLWGCHCRPMARGWLSLPQLQAIPCSPRLIPGFWRQWKIQIPFFGKTGSKGSRGEALKGMSIFRDADLRPDKEL